jgi:hypothetical protein
MAPSPFGKGYSSRLGRLEITVEVWGKSWNYWIQEGGKEIARHVPCWLWNQTDESAKIEAVERALELLGWQADAMTISNSLEWRLYEPGHHE